MQYCDHNIESLRNLKATLDFSKVFIESCRIDDTNRTDFYFFLKNLTKPDDFPISGEEKIVFLFMPKNDRKLALLYCPRYANMLSFIKKSIEKEHSMDAC